MEQIPEYLFSIATAAVICTLVKHITGEKTNAGKIVRVVSGLFLIITILSPLLDFRIGSIEQYFENIQYDAEYIVTSGSEAANSQMGEIIKEQTESYILDEIERLDAQLKVEVKVTDTNPPEPYQVIISGSVSPYQKKNLMQYVSQYLGISQEHQIWN